MDSWEVGRREQNGSPVVGGIVHRGGRTHWKGAPSPGELVMPPAGRRGVVARLTRSLAAAFGGAVTAVAVFLYS